ncbi:hypothetical protein ACFLYR_08925 [Chloroflexota bacterium]
MTWVLLHNPFLKYYQTLSKVMREGYSMGRIIRRIWHLFKKRPDPYSALVYLFMQLGTRKDARAVPPTE